MHETAEADAIAVLLGLSSAAVADLMLKEDTPKRRQKRSKKLMGDQKSTKRVHNTKEKPKKRVKKDNAQEHLNRSSVQPRVIQMCSPAKLQVDHSYKDYSLVAPSIDYKVPTKLDEMTFPEKLHRILSDSEYASLIKWESHGRAFRILLPCQLEEQKVFHRYFGHSSFTIFLTQLRRHGFKQLFNRKNSGCYYHESMLRGLPHLTIYINVMKEVPELSPDPENEPDFDAISSTWPLPLTWTPSKMTTQSSMPIVAPRATPSPPNTSTQEGSPQAEIFVNPPVVSPINSAATDNGNPSLQSQILGFLYEQMNPSKPISQPTDVENQLALFFSNPNMFHQAQQQQQQQMMMIPPPPTSAQPLDPASLLFQTLGLVADQHRTAVPTTSHDPNLLVLDSLFKHYVSGMAAHPMHEHAPALPLHSQSAVNHLLASLLGFPREH